MIEESRIHLLLHLPIEEENEDRWCLWRPDQAGFDCRSIFEGALVEGSFRSSLLAISRIRTFTYCQLASYGRNVIDGEEVEPD